MRRRDRAGGDREQRSVRVFVGHFVEMLIVMFAGMGVFSGLTALGFLATGSSLTDQAGELRILLMGVNMTVPMVLWMAVRGHVASRNAEMAAAMLMPSIAAAGLVRWDAVGVMAGFTIQHTVMVPAMLAVMLWRYQEYALRHSPRQQRSTSS